jgi:hypothetical protein
MKTEYHYCAACGRTVAHPACPFAKASCDTPLDLTTVRAPAGVLPSTTDNAKTWPPLSMVTAQCGLVWAEGMYARARTCAGDGARFMAGLGA